MPAGPTIPQKEPATPSATMTPAEPRVWISPALPRLFQSQLHLPSGWQAATNREAANLWIEIPPLARSGGSSSKAGATLGASTRWVYALAAPFPTVTDEVSIQEIQSAWKGKLAKAQNGRPLLVTAETRDVLKAYWGPASTAGIRVVDPAGLLDAAWNETAWAIIPFEEIKPRWKILRVDRQSPLDKEFDPQKYPLAIPILAHAPGNASLNLPGSLPSNRDPEKLTVLVMTGVTALSRHIGERMESKGLTYPARDIRDWLASADLTHISNEVSFYTMCPKPGPERADMRFCSSPKYIALLEDVGTDIVELTGNHNLDWGLQPFLDSLVMYRQRGWGTYGGGTNLAEAQQPLRLEDHGNKIAFLGCSPAGPQNVWATADKPGSTPCNFDRLEQEIRDLRSAGYLPVVTLQAVETDTYLPPPAQGAPDFRRLARVGAVIVSGSQSHVPQTMTFVDLDASGQGEITSSFVHYGLGNLFFDQMKPIETRQEFIDRHVFYNGKYLGVELLTALLEDYARPRPMNPAERQSFLQKIFALSSWSESGSQK